MNYSGLLTLPISSCAEKCHEYFYLTERHLQAIWFEQKYFSALTTDTGLPITVLSPGIWNAESGPDFHKGHFKINEQDIKGDVEIHLDDESWVNHNHHQDEKYNNVVLHISLRRPKNERELSTSNGQKMHRAYLETAFTVPQARLIHLIDLDLYPYKKFVGSGKCAQTLFRFLPEHDFLEFFRNAALWRLDQKLQYLEMHGGDSSKQLGLGIARALGYKSNSDAFAQLFHNLNISKSELEMLAEAMLYCGFFEKKYQEKWKNSFKYCELLEMQKDRFPNLKIQLELSQIRPLNHPLRRLVLLCKILSNHSLDSFYKQLMGTWEISWRYGNGKLLPLLLAILPEFEDPYWNSHYNFEENVSSNFLTLLGKNSRMEILTNTFLPLLWKEIRKRENPDEILVFQDFFSSIPASFTGKTKYLIHRFFGDTVKGKAIKNADAEQGAYQLHRDFCLHYEASCEGCPFVEKFRSLYGGKFYER